MLPHHPYDGLDIRAELARIDKVRAEIHRQFQQKPFTGWVWMCVPMAGMMLVGAAIFAAGAVFMKTMGN